LGNQGESRGKTAIKNDLAREEAIAFFSGLAGILITLSLALWASKSMIMNIVNEKHSSLKSINRLIEELLLNGYKLE
jgi:hypothetical protein